MDYNDIIFTDHLGYLTDINLSEYCNIEDSNINKIQSSHLNSQKISYRIKFCKKLDEIIERTNLIKIVNKYCHIYTTDEILEMIDKKISYVLNKARKYIKGPNRQILYSKAKVKARAEQLY